MERVAQGALIVAVGLIALLGGLLAGSQLKLTDPGVQTALIGLFGVLLVALIGVGGVELGARIGAMATRDAAKVAEQEARAARASAEAARRQDRTLALTTRVLADSDLHRDQVEAQAHRRNELDREGGDPNSIRTLDSTDAIYDAVGGLYLSADEAVADRAWDLYQATTRLDSFRYDAAHHRIGEHILPLTDGQWEEFTLKLTDYGRAKAAFIAAARADLGLPPMTQAEGGTGAEAPAADP